jgi:hypothetical protein
MSMFGEVVTQSGSPVSLRDQILANSLGMSGVDPMQTAFVDVLSAKAIDTRIGVAERITVLESKAVRPELVDWALSGQYKRVERA